MGYSKALLALASAATVAAHGHVSDIIVNGVWYEGYNSPSWYNQPNAAPNVVGWTIDQTDNGFVAPDAFGDPDIICHRSATPAQSHVEVAAGDTVFIQWTVWPDSHHGPMLDYLANCNGPCESVDKTTLEFFKIDEVGIITQGNPGVYGDDVMVEFNSSWNVQIPKNIAPGNYVLRHETIALHSAGQVNGAQAYPQCFNLLITGSGTETPAGTLGTELYGENDPGIVVNIYTSSVDYIIPGPTLISGVPSSISQSTSTATATSSATPSGSGGGGGSGAPTSAPPTTSGPASTGVPPTTIVTSTTSASSGGGGGSGNGAPLYGQCGGQGWSGATTCAEGTCTELNDYFYQCVP